MLNNIHWVTNSIEEEEEDKEFKLPQKGDTIKYGRYGQVVKLFGSGVEGTGHESMNPDLTIAILGKR